MQNEILSAFLFRHTRDVTLMSPGLTKRSFILDSHSEGKGWTRQFSPVGRETEAENSHLGKRNTEKFLWNDMVGMKTGDSLMAETVQLETMFNEQL